ncbi:MAG: hypothetical protein ACRDNS_00730, partial [Trebonia sp.]
MAGVCSIPGVSLVCGGVGDVASAAASSAVDAIAKALADGLATVLTTVTTFWTKLDVPSFATSGSPVILLQQDLFLLQGFIVVASLLYAAARMAITRDGKPAGQAAGSLMLTIVVSGVGLTAIDLVSTAGDNYSAWIINK